MLFINFIYNADQETRIHGINANQKEYIQHTIASGLTKPRDIQLFLFNKIQCGLPIREPTMQQLYHFICMKKKENMAMEIVYRMLCIFLCDFMR